jgi:peptide deformylase
MALPRSDQGWITGIAGDGIVTIGDPRLKQQTAAVEAPEDAAGLLAAMVTRLRGLNGAGLAAPQIGAAVRVVVVEVRRTDVFPDRPETPLLEMVNPVITARSDAEVTDWEAASACPA